MCGCLTKYQFNGTKSGNTSVLDGASGATLYKYNTFKADGGIWQKLFNGRRNIQPNQRGRGRVP